MKAIGTMTDSGESVTMTVRKKVGHKKLLTAHSQTGTTPPTPIHVLSLVF